MKPTDFAHHLTAFLTDYLAGQRQVSPHTSRPIAMSSYFSYGFAGISMASSPSDSTWPR